MSQQLNCWEFMECGHTPDSNEADRDICPATQAAAYHGVNGGHNAGRFCWPVEGTLCNGQVQGTFTEKVMDCMRCSFYAHLAHEYHNTFIINPDQLD